MPKFIKFLNDYGMHIFNSDEIIKISFFTKELSIVVNVRDFSEVKIQYENTDHFKINCDSIMEQLGL